MYQHESLFIKLFKVGGSKHEYSQKKGLRGHTCRTEFPNYDVPADCIKQTLQPYDVAFHLGLTVVVPHLWV